MNYFQQLGDRIQDQQSHGVMPRTQMRYEAFRSSGDESIEESATVEAPAPSGRAEADPNSSVASDTIGHESLHPASNSDPTIHQHITNEENNYLVESEQDSENREQPSTELDQKIRQIENRLDEVRNPSAAENSSSPPVLENNYISQDNSVHNEKFQSGDTVHQNVDQTSSVFNTRTQIHETQVRNTIEQRVTNLNQTIEQPNLIDNSIHVDRSLHQKSTTNSLTNIVETHDNHEHVHLPDRRPNTLSSTTPTPEIVVDRGVDESSETVTVSIGRIEVRPSRQSHASPPATTPPRPQARVMSLDEYLQKNGGMQ